MRDSEPFGLFAVCSFSQAGLGRGFRFVGAGLGHLACVNGVAPLRGRGSRKADPGPGATRCVMQDARNVHLEVERQYIFICILGHCLGRMGEFEVVNLCRFDNS